MHLNPATRNIMAAPHCNNCGVVYCGQITEYEQRQGVLLATVLLHSTLRSFKITALPPADLHEV